MPAVINDQGNVTDVASNTKKFTANTQVNVYSRKSLNDRAKIGYIPKGSSFSADADSNSWYKITKYSSSTFKGKYVKKMAEGKSYNFSSKADDSATEDTTNNTSQTTEATTTTDPNTGEQVPTSTDAEGNETAETDYSDLFPTQLDDEFMEEYAGTASFSDYQNQISSGLTIKELRGVLGIPHQFLPSTDPRINKDNAVDVGDAKDFGRVYTEKILRYMPLLLITPGIPTFMSGFSDEQRGVVAEVLAGIADTMTLEGVEADDYFGKYYSLKFAYVDYFKYVNAMLRSAAVFLNIHEVKVDGKALKKFNWLYDGTSINPTNASGIGKFLGPYVGAIAFYADCGTSIGDSFSNATAQSQLANALGSLSDTGRELNFLVGNVGSLAGIKLNALTGEEDLLDNMSAAREAINGVLSGNNIMSNILNKAQTILAGGRLVFPEIWSDSSFGRSYSCQMKLVSPSGDKLSIYLNILVPIYHLLAMALPRQSIQQAYFSPFLLRCYYKGLFNVDMGIMTGLSITKGAEAEWAYDGIPTVAEVSFEIKDLYDGMFMSRADDEGAMGILSNITELDYIANSCGININDQEVMRTMKLWKVLKLDNLISDIVYSDILGGIIQYFNGKLQSLFGVF